MAIPNQKPSGARNTDVIIVDSGTNTHMSPKADRVQSTTYCNIKISLADDFTVVASSMGNRNVWWMNNERARGVSLEGTLVAPDVSMILLSIPALVRKNIATLFLPSKALFST